jgi:hypothetical protein
LPRHIARIVATLIAVSLACLLAVAHSRYYIAYSFAAAAIVWLRTRPPKRRYLYVAAIAAALWAIRIAFAEQGTGPADPLPEQIFYVTAGFVGAGSLIMFAMFGLSDERAADPIELAAAFGISAFGLIADWWFRFMTDHPLPSLDRTLFAVDDRLGFQASFAAGRAFGTWPPLAWLSGAAYRMLPLTIAFVFVSLPRRAAKIRFGIAIASAAAIGYVAYRLCPAAGPAYAFSTFPSQAPAIAAGWVHPVEMNSSLLNAFPSLHATWALLVLWWGRMLRPAARAAVTVAVMLTVIAPLGLGEHYRIDLAVAAPFAVVFEMVCSIEPSAWMRQAALGALCAIAFVWWLVAVRTGRVLAMDPIAVRTLAAATISLPLGLRLGTR